MNEEQTKKCKECQMDIPKKARRCPHCRAKQGIGFWGLILIIFLVGFTLSIVMSTINDMGSTSNTNYDVGTYVPPVRESTFELGTYKVESTEFAYINPKEVNLWQSYSDRKKVGSVKEHAVVEVTAYDEANDYCKITAGEQAGWMACNWLIKAE